MPHDNKGRPIYIGDYVTGRTETFPGHVWEGVGRVVEIREGSVCNVTIAEVETAPWKNADYDDESPPTSYGHSRHRVATYRQTEFRVDVAFIDASADALTVIYESMTRASDAERLRGIIRGVAEGFRLYGQNAEADGLLALMNE